MRRILFLLLAGFALGVPSQATVILQNGGFELTTGGDLGAGLFLLQGWTNNSGLSAQASSAAIGFEGTNGALMTGSRFLRLASDNPDPLNTGFIVQNVGTMVAGETYSLLGDLFGGGSVGLLFAADVRFASDGAVLPTTTYAQITTTGLAAGASSIGGLSLSYTAQQADDGQSLFVWIRALPSGSGQAIRGGMDNLTLTATSAVPEPSTLALASFALLALVIRYRR